MDGIKHKNLQAVKSKDSRIELLLRKELWSRGLRYRKNVSKLPGKPDIVFPKARVAVFCDGEFWHGYDWENQKKLIKSNQSFWYNKIERNMQRDKEVDLKLKKAGWLVLRFWGNEITKNVNKCANIIQTIILQRESENMPNNAELGMTLQKCICDYYQIEPCDSAKKQFEASYNNKYKAQSDKIIDLLFSELGMNPIECLTFTPSENAGERLSPHNFRLSDGSSLSIRTNIKGDKVAPRVVGQAGLDTFNEHFSDIAGFRITDKNEIKSVVFNNIHLMLPVFIDYFFVSDYTVWVHEDDNGDFTYTLFNKDSFVDIDLDRSAFTFTKDLLSWNESTTLKYKGKSLAEIQIHKNRTFKFRFIMNALSDLLVEQKITNETLGITAEKAICDLFRIPTPKEYKGRYSNTILKEISPTIKVAFDHLPAAKESTGALKGERGKTSKCPYDFILNGNKTLSLKTNSGSMICPPDVGQPGAKTCYYYFGKYMDSSEATSDSFKKMVLEHISELMPIYVSHLFESDYLLWVFKRKDSYDYKIYDSNFARDIVWEKYDFSFTKPSLDEWNESNTLKYKGISIGEFQVHSRRTCYKFRFNMDNFDYLIRNNIVKKNK